MKEFDEDEAIKLMCEAAALSGADIDAQDDDDDDANSIADYVKAQLAKSPAALPLSAGQIEAMVKAELDYEDSII